VTKQETEDAVVALNLMGAAFCLNCFAILAFVTALGITDADTPRIPEVYVEVALSIDFDHWFHSLVLLHFGGLVGASLSCILDPVWESMILFSFLAKPI